MIPYVRSRHVFVLVVFLFGISQPFCGISQAAATNSPASNLKLKAEIEKVLTTPKPGDRLKGLAETAKKLFLEEIPAALEAAKTFRQLREQAVFQEGTLKRWSELAPRDAFVHIAALPESRIKLEAIRVATIHYASQNVEEASRVVERLTGGRCKNEAVAGVADTWARKNVKEALRWANALPEGFSRETALNSIRFIWVHSDPVSAVEHVIPLPAGDTKNALLTNIAGEWAGLDPQAALRWGNSLSDGPEKDLVLANVAESWADSDPKAAAAFALTLSGVLKQNAAAGVISRWATQDPEAAMNWVLKTGDEGIQSRAFSEVLNLWASVDAAKAGKWVEHLPSGLPRDSAILSYIEAVITWEPSGALRLANSLKDESIRIQQVEKCLQRWIELDKSGAQKWVKASELPQEFKDRWMLGNGPQ